MTTRLRDSERTKLIAYYIRTGKSPEGYEITENESSKYKVRKIKSLKETLENKRDRLKNHLEIIEAELNKLNLNDKNIKEVKEEEEIKKENSPSEEINDKLFEQ